MQPTLSVPSIRYEPFEDAVKSWTLMGGTSMFTDQNSHLQRTWDEEICRSRFALLLGTADIVNRARLLAVSSPASGAWLSALPLANLGLHLLDKKVHVSVGLRMDSTLSRPRIWGCGTKVTDSSVHGLSCRKGSSHLSRHAAINDIIARAFRSVDIPASLEPQGLMRDYGKRPDGRLPLLLCSGHGGNA